jgi:hypothetical protein
MNGKQILQQIEVNYSAMDKLGDRMALNPPLPQQVQLQKELNRLWQAQKYWAGQYKLVTGENLELVAPIRLTDSRAEEANALAQQRQQAAAKQRAADAIVTVERELTTVANRLQSQYEVSVQWENALFSHWTRMGAGLHAKHPIIVKKQMQEKVAPLLRSAREHLAKGNYNKAMAQASAAADWVKWGIDFYNWWMGQLESGAKRAEAGIKVSAALAAIVVAAPVEVGVLGAMAVASAGEGAQQGTLLAAKYIDGKEQISQADVDAAIKETVVAGISAGFSKLGKLVSCALAPRVAGEVAKRAPGKELVEFVAGRIESYIAANSQVILKKRLGLDKEPDWNWWYTVITPAIGPISMEIAKEPDLLR